MLSQIYVLVEGQMIQAGSQEHLHGSPQWVDLFGLGLAVGGTAVLHMSLILFLGLEREPRQVPLMAIEEV